MLFNDILPFGMPFYNYTLNKKKIGGLISDCFKLLGKGTTLRLLDDIKDVGYKSATRAGLSFAKNDMRVPAPARRPTLPGARHFGRGGEAVRLGGDRSGARAR